MVVLTAAGHRGRPWLGRRGRCFAGVVRPGPRPAVFLMVGLVLIGLTRAARPSQRDGNPIEQLAAGRSGARRCSGFIAVLAGGVREELQRAFLLRRFEQHLGGPVGVLVLSIAFGLGTIRKGGTR